jgi:hypothetical protein
MIIDINTLKTENSNLKKQNETYRKKFFWVSLWITTSFLYYIFG